MLSTGYLALWSRLHRAEENLYMVAPDALVEAEALYDYTRIQGSNIPNSEQLISRLRWAVSLMNPEIAKNITPPGAAIATPGDNKQTTPEEVRALLCGIRRILNEYRDGLWDGIIRQKNHLVEAVIVTRSLSFILLAVLVIIHVPVGALIAAAVFYFVGALAGLFSRLRPGSPGPDTAQPVEDYGFTSSTLLQTPMLSGLAAVGGVMLVALLTVVVDNTSLTPGGEGTCSQPDRRFRPA